ncbi:hypothetical protein H4Q26_007663 [Puccinia striiformis f. sp. tritici PST-130]|nr:hypothetical protein H4Q26_007663 [Puccinia striiformis f. sp. tritici PST-130]
MAAEDGEMEVNISASDVGVPQMGLRPPKGVARKIQATMHSNMKRCAPRKRSPPESPALPITLPLVSATGTKIVATTRRTARRTRPGSLEKADRYTKCKCPTRS